jgi:hypothetical protein
MEEEGMGVGAEMDGNVVRAPKEKKKQKLWIYACMVVPPE